MIRAEGGVKDNRLSPMSKAIGSGLVLCSFWRSHEETIDNITEAIELYLESLKADNQPIPKEDLIFKSLSILG